MCPRSLTGWQPAWDPRHSAASRTFSGGRNTIWFWGGLRLENAEVPGPQAVLVRPLTAGDRRWVRATWGRNRPSTTVARRGEFIDARDLAGYVALLGGRRTGLVLVDLRDDDLEVVAISTSTPGQGGRARPHEAVCRPGARVRVSAGVAITTNNNTTAIAFYQRVGMDLCAYYRHGVRASRLLKPSIPLRDSSGVPIDHELEFELLLGPEFHRLTT